MQLVHVQQVYRPIAKILPGVVNRPASRPDGGNRHGAPAARAEAALAAGQIPPGLRAYLKNYFSAIAPR